MCVATNSSCDEPPSRPDAHAASLHPFSFVEQQALTRADVFLDADFRWEVPSDAPASHMPDDKFGEADPLGEWDAFECLCEPDGVTAPSEVVVIDEI